MSNRIANVFIRVGLPTQTLQNKIKPFLAKIIKNAFGDIEQATAIFFIGCSFSEKHFSDKLKKSLSNCEAIYNINCDAKSTDKLKMIFGQEVNHIGKHFENMQPGPFMPQQIPQPIIPEEHQQKIKEQKVIRDAGIQPDLPAPDWGNKAKFEGPKD